MNLLSNQVAIVTGGSSGIGEAIARLFAAEGAAVMIVHHDEPGEAQEIVDSIVIAGGRARPCAADVGKPEDIERLFTTTRREFGTATILVNSAGVDAAGICVADMEPAHFDDVIRTNLIGPFLSCRAFVCGLRESKQRGKIINVSSVH